MKIGFTGDLVLQNVEKSPNDIFASFKKYIDSKEINLCINLESPFIEESMCSFKNKIVLYAYDYQYNYIDFLSPYLINLGNNHINDFGNKSSALTMKILHENNQAFFGIGYDYNRKNIFIDSTNKIIYISFCTRSSDLTGSRLFAESEFIGPYDVDYEQVRYYERNYTDYKIIVNIHWGLEDVIYPEPEKRNIAHKLIDSGANLIIGHHSHIIQPLEIYKGSYIFYSIGNFYFNDINFKLNEELILKKALKHQKCGIIPIFDYNLNLSDILLIKIGSDLSLKFKEGFILKKITINEEKYKIFYKYYFFLFRLVRKSLLICRNLCNFFYRIFN